MVITVVDDNRYCRETLLDSSLDGTRVKIDYHFSRKVSEGVDYCKSTLHSCCFHW